MKAINTSKLLTGKQKNLPAALKQKIIKAKMKKMKKVKKKMASRALVPITSSRELTTIPKKGKKIKKT